MSMTPNNVTDKNPTTVCCFCHSHQLQLQVQAIIGSHPPEAVLSCLPFCVKIFSKRWNVSVSGEETVYTAPCERCSKHVE